MVQIVDWPEDVPLCIMPSSPQGGLRDTRYSFETDSRMPPLERPAASWVGEIYSIELAPMTVAEFSAFQAWYLVALSQGVNGFVMPHPVTKAASVWKIGKGEPPYQVQKTGRIPTDSGARRIVLSFSVMSLPLAVPE